MSGRKPGCTAKTCCHGTDENGLPDTLHCAMTAQSEPRLTVAMLKRDVHLPRDAARYITSLETALTESQAEADKQRHIAANAENMTAMHKAELDEARAECERLRQELENERMKVTGCSTAALGYWKEGDFIHPAYDCAAIRDVARTYAKYVAAETREREAYSRAAAICSRRARGQKAAAQTNWNEDHVATGNENHWAAQCLAEAETEIRALSGERREG